jgi:hypothetical protein
MPTPEHNAAVKRILLKAHPDWRGRIWFFKNSVTVRGIANVWGGRPHHNPLFDNSAEAEARNLLAELEWCIENCGDRRSGPLGS